MTWKTPVIIAMSLVVLAGHQVSGRSDEQVKEEMNQIDVGVIPTEFLAPTASISATETASPSAVLTMITTTASPTTAVKVSVTPKPTQTIEPQPEFTQEQMYEFTERYGGEFGVDPNVLRHIALCESGFNPSAKNLVYGGLFQFDGSTWKNYRSRMGLDMDTDLRFHAEEAIKTAAHALSQNASRLWPGCYPK